MFSDYNKNDQMIYWDTNEHNETNLTYDQTTAYYYECFIVYSTNICFVCLHGFDALCAFLATL